MNKTLLVLFPFLFSCSNSTPAGDTYFCKYKLQGDMFWNTQENIKGDFIAEDLKNTRVLVLSDETRLEIPIEGTLFKFSNGRFLAIKKNMEAQTGQTIKTK